MCKRLLGLILVAASLSVVGCIGVSAHETIQDNNLQVAVVGDEIYLVDVRQKTATRLTIIEPAVSTPLEDTATMSESSP